MVQIYYEADADIALLTGKRIAIIGYGSQGHAHALNLHDSGCDVVVGLYPGSRSWATVAEAGLPVKSVADAAKEADIIMMLTPDHTQKQIYDESIRPGLKPGKMLMFAHGFTIHFNQVVPAPDIDVTMIAPKSPGHMVRRLYTEGVGVPALIAVHQDASGHARALALAYAKAIGSTKAGVLDTTFREETETDLFGEQAVLCGGIAALITAGYDALVDAGYKPESAYFECLHELKLIVDLIYQGGLDFMRFSISDTAEWGDYTCGPRIINENVRAEMKKLLAEIQDGSFARNWILENQTGRPSFNALRRRNAGHSIEAVGKQLRSMMPWLKPIR